MTNNIESYFDVNLKYILSSKQKPTFCIFIEFGNKRFMLTQNTSTHNTYLNFILHVVL